ALVGGGFLGSLTGFLEGFTSPFHRIVDGFAGLLGRTLFLAGCKRQGEKTGNQHHAGFPDGIGNHSGDPLSLDPYTALTSAVPERSNFVKLYENCPAGFSPGGRKTCGEMPVFGGAISRLRSRRYP
ncbi:MAG: hypothetical protein ACR2RA_10040, partial [Geminicoccaceae bacterium]